MNDIETPIPKLMLAQSTVVTCAHCGAWYGRIPAFMGDSLDKGDYCDRCGATSYKTRKGRPFGPKSKDWDWVLSEWAWLYPTLVSTPEFKELLETAEYRL